MTRNPVSLILALAVAALQERTGPGVAIRHEPVGCVVAGRFPQFEARFDPADRVGRARLHFRPEGGRYWYSVAMTREGELFRGVMPRPRRSLKAFTYYIEATGVDFMASRTEEYSPEVVSGPGACQQKLVAVALSSASVVVEVPAGAPALPAGFSTSGVATAGTGGASAGTGGATAGTGGASAGAAGGAGAAGAAGAATGISIGLVAGVVGGGAAIAGVAVAAGGKGGTKPGPQASSTNPPATAPATTAPAAPSTLTGQWFGISPDGVVQSAGGCAGQQNDLSLALVQSGSALSGSFDSPVRASAPSCAPVGTHFIGTLTGIVGSDTVSFTASYAQPAGAVPDVFTGTFTANRMSGTWAATAGHHGAGTWSVNRR